MRGMWLNYAKRGSTVLFFLNCSLHWVISMIVGFLLSLQQRKDSGSENRGEVVSRECSQKSVKSLVHQQDKYAGAGGCEGGVKGLGNLYRKTWHSKSSEELLNKDVVSKEDDALLEGGVIVIASRGYNDLIEGGVGEDVN